MIAKISVEGDTLSSAFLRRPQKFTQLSSWFTRLVKELRSFTKGQIISKAICVFLTSPKKQRKKRKKIDLSLL